MVTPLRFLASEQEELATVKAEFARYVRQSMVKFATGALDLDKDWPAYVANLDKLGKLGKLDKAKILAAYQKAYDRQYKAK